MQKPRPPEPPALKGQCPYHEFAQTQTQEGDKLTEFAELLNGLFNNLIVYDGITRHNDVVTAYTGKLILQSSLHNQSLRFPKGEMAIPSDKHTPLGRMIGNIHAQYRKAAYDMGGILDVESLKPETQESIRRFQKTMRLYRGAVQETSKQSASGLPDYALLPEAQRKEFESLTVAAISELKHSELMTAESVPVKTAQGVFQADNIALSSIPRTDRETPQDMKLGLYLFVLQEAAGTQVDHNKLPPIATAFGKGVGVLAGIPRIWGCMSNPQIKAQVEQVCGETYQHVLAEVRNEAHALQVTHLLLSIDDANGRIAREICRTAGIPPYPERLSSPLEAAVIIEAFNLAAPKSMEHEKALLGAAARTLQNDEPLTPQQAVLVEGALARVPVARAEGSAEAFSTGQLLLTEFLKQYRSPAHPRVADAGAAIYQGR